MQECSQWKNTQNWVYPSVSGTHSIFGLYPLFKPLYPLLQVLMVHSTCILQYLLRCTLPYTTYSTITLVPKVQSWLYPAQQLMLCSHIIRNLNTLKYSLIVVITKPSFVVIELLWSFAGNKVTYPILFVRTLTSFAGFW